MNNIIRLILTVHRHSIVSMVMVSGRCCLKVISSTLTLLSAMVTRPHYNHLQL